MTWDEVVVWAVIIAGSVGLVALAVFLLARSR
jgi:hypothetical protein